MKTDKETKGEVWELPIPTRDGEFIASYSDTGLCSLDFPKPQKQNAGRTNGTRIPSQVRRWHEQTIKALEGVLAGPPIKESPPLDLSRGTDFQQRVWYVLKSI